MSKVGKATITLAALAVLLGALWYVPFFVALPLMAAFGVGMFWLWKS